MRTTSSISPFDPFASTRKPLVAESDSNDSDNF